MNTLFFLLLIGAVACFAVAAFASRQPTRVNLVALGLLLWVLVPLIEALRALD